MNINIVLLMRLLLLFLIGIVLNGFLFDRNQVELVGRLMDVLHIVHVVVHIIKNIRNVVVHVIVVVIIVVVIVYMGIGIGFGGVEGKILFSFLHQHGDEFALEVGLFLQFDNSFMEASNGHQQCIQGLFNRELSFRHSYNNIIIEQRSTRSVNNLFLCLID